MAENRGDGGGQGGVREGEALAPQAAGRAGAPPRPTTIALPPRSSLESLFRNSGGGGGASETSPGPLTLVSSFFAEDSESECGSFTQLLVGAINSPVAAAKETDKRTGGGELDSGGGGGGGLVRLGQNLPPPSLAINQLQSFTVPPGFSPASLLDSPAFFSSSPMNFALSHQEALAQVTAQAAQSQCRMLDQTELSSPSLTAATTSSPQKSTQEIPALKTVDSALESEEVSQSDQRSQHTTMIVDRPANDGYNWRKYGQKVVKGSECPRSYYKCTHPNCLVKKKIECSVDGQVTEIIYKGQHNHQCPAPNKHASGSLPSGPNKMNGKFDNPKPGSIDGHGNFGSLNKRSVAPLTRNDQESGCRTLEQLSGSSDSEEVADIRTDEGDDGERDPKRRNMITSSQKTLTEPRIIVQTTSEVDLLDDGFRWRKYGQKVVKGNPYPRSYYKCTYGGCNVRKHIERSPTDPKAIITTYEGKHSHDVPAARNSRHNASNSVGSNKASHTSAKFKNYNQTPVASSHLKEEHENT